MTWGRSRKVVEIQAIEDLVVVVPWRCFLGCRERPRVGRFEEQNRRTGFGELRMQLRVVEGVLVVRDDLDRAAPGACWRVCFGVPKLTEMRWVTANRSNRHTPTT